MNELVKIENNDIVVEQNLIEDFIKFKKLKDEMDLKEKEFKQALKDAMEKVGKNNFIVPGLSATLKKATTRKSVDTTRLKNELPDIYEEYLKESPVASSITLTIAD